MNLLPLSAILIPFSVLASVMAYLIAYNEWMRHYPAKKEPRRMAREAAIFTFIFFTVLSLFVGFFLEYFVIPR